MQLIKKIINIFTKEKAISNIQHKAKSPTKFKKKNQSKAKPLSSTPASLTLQLNEEFFFLFCLVNYALIVLVQLWEFNCMFQWIVTRGLLLNSADAEESQYELTSRVRNQNIRKIMGFYIVPGNNGEVPIFFATLYTLPLFVFVR